MTDSLTAKIAIDDTCDRFEAAWENYLSRQRGRSAPRIEDFLADFNPDASTTLLSELLSLELYFLKQIGETPASQHYLDRFPDAGAAIKAVFERHQDGNAEQALSDLPAKLGRYQIVEKIAEGGFANVYRAIDDTLRRPVALKIANLRQITSGAAAAEGLVNEARSLASLRHPNIVTIHDVETTDDGLCFIVTELIDGTNLASLMSKGRPSFEQSATIVATIAEALHFAHTNQLVHRDIKPGNILLDASGRPYLADFGLALHDADFGKLRKQGGTVAYMSPEQARGEGHLVDGRSDIFSLGIVFYELLTGVLPFRGNSTCEILDRIADTEPRPLRMVDDQIPREFERICLKALAKRATDRYSVAKDLAEEIHGGLKLLADPQGATLSAADDIRGTRPQVVPKGLRAFDADDSEFFTRLLPGPCDASGLPESIRFWKAKIESTTTASFRIGLLYGPSGCGKSSLVKAGLLPRLDPRVIQVFVEATADDTEVRLLRSLRKACPQTADETNLAAAVATLRRERSADDGKILIVVDQFEQWLHAHRERPDISQLTQALRQCDGERVQGLILVRDDFWSPVSRFMRELEIPIVDGSNAQVVELFEANHARRVLIALGQAYGRIPQDDAELSRQQQLFINRAVTDLTKDGRVVPVRLALFCEMVKHRPWTLETYEAIGGADGAGIRFFEENFAAPTAPPQHKIHLKAARAVLAAMLPEVGSNLKGYVRSVAELRELSGYASRPQDFQELIRILDCELRVITPSGKEPLENDAHADDESGTFYQLTHDFIVANLRQWLTNEQRSTMRGRAQLMMDECTQLWRSNTHRRRLPSLREYLAMRLLTSQKTWNQRQREMMHSAGRRYFAWTALAAVLLVALVLGGRAYRDRVKTNTLIRGLLRSEVSQLPAFSDELSSLADLGESRLREIYQDPSASDDEKLRAALVLVRIYGDVEANESAVAFLRKRLLEAEPDELVVICDSLAEFKQEIADELWEKILSDDAQHDALVALRTTVALRRFFPDDERWQQTSRYPIEYLSVMPSALKLERWLNALQSSRNLSLDPVIRILQDPETTTQQRVRTTDIAVTLGENDAAFLSQLILVCDESDYPLVLSLLSRLGDTARDLLQKMWDETRLSPRNVETQESSNVRLELALARLGQIEPSLELMRHNDRDPDRATAIVHGLAAHKCDPMPYADRLVEALVAGEKNTELIMGLCQAVGEFPPSEIGDRRRQMLTQLRKTFTNHPHPGVHSSVEWLLRVWGEQETIDQALADVSTESATIDWHPDNVEGQRRWFVNGQLQTMAIVEGGVFVKGAPDTEPDWSDDEVERPVSIRRVFAVSTHEVTKEQYLRSNPDAIPAETLARFPEDQCPIGGVSWYQAAQYCNWLSDQEGIPESQWCYLPNAQGDYDEGMSMAPGYLSKSGYRLPTDSEWEFACRGGTTGRRFFGDDIRWLKKYAWHEDNSQSDGRLEARSVGLLKPNQFGLFDIYGNVWEWTQDRINLYDKSQVDSDIPIDDTEDETLVILGNIERCRRGGGHPTRALSVRSANRSGRTPRRQKANCGFRVVRTISPLHRVERRP